MTAGRLACLFALPIYGACVVACGGDDGISFGDAGEEGAAAHDSGGEDATVPNDGSFDAGRGDAARDGDAAVVAIGDGSSADADARVDANDASSADAEVDASDAGATGDAGDAGQTTATILVSDTTLNRIDLLTTSGVLLHSYTSPVANVTGVSHDRRVRDGFWIMGRDDAQTIYKRAWSGLALPSVTNTTPSFLGTNVRGLDHWVATDGGADLLTFIERNNQGVDALMGIRASDGVGTFSMGFFAGGSFDAGFWGVSMLNFSESANEMLAWVTHDISSPAIERWRTASYQAGVPVAAPSPRGVTRTANGEFWVVDPTNARVVHLDGAGNVLGSFKTPGTDPAGLSYDPGP